MKKRFIYLVALLVILCMSACGNKAEEQNHDHEHEHEEVKVVANLRIGLEAHEGQPQYEAAVRMAKEIEAKSEGALKATVYGAGKLGTDEELLNYLETEEDAIDIVIASASTIAKYKPGFNIAEMPFAMGDYDTVRTFVTSEAQYYATRGLEEKNMHTLAYYMDGFHVLLCSEQKISRAEDLQGARVFVADNGLGTIAMKMLGAQTEVQSLGEMRESVQQGRSKVVSGRIEDIYQNRLYQGQQYLVRTNHSFELSGVVISEKLWDELDAEYQQVIQQAAVNSSYSNIEEVRQADNKMISDMEAAGLRIVTPNPESFWKKAEASVRNYASEYKAVAEQLIMWKASRQ